MPKLEYVPHRFRADSLAIIDIADRWDEITTYLEENPA